MQLVHLCSHGILCEPLLHYIYDGCGEVESWKFWLTRLIQLQNISEEKMLHHRILVQILLLRGKWEAFETIDRKRTWYIWRRPELIFFQLCTWLMLYRSGEVTLSGPPFIYTSEFRSSSTLVVLYLPRIWKKCSQNTCMIQRKAWLDLCRLHLMVIEALGEVALLTP